MIKSDAVPAVTDTLSPAERSERMSRVRGQDTGPEMIVRRLVHGMGYRYRTHVAALPGKPDLVFRSRRRVIFVHGCFWHRHRCPLGRLPKSRLDFWKTKLDANRARDRKVMRALRAAGWHPHVVWECELRDLAALAARLKAFLDA